MKNPIAITSKDNKIIKYVKKLQSSAKFRKSENRFVIEGLRICKDAFENNVSFDSLLFSEEFCLKHKNEYDYFSSNADSVYILSNSVFEKISDTDTPQGIIIIAKIPEITAKISQNKRYIALDNLQDPANLGAIARTCEALGVGGIIINSTACDPFSPKTLRSSMGTLVRMPVYITEDITEFLNFNNLRGFSCVVEEGAEKIGNVDFKNGDVIIIGNEANGISDDVKSGSYKLITIPMSGKAESLNASATAAIAIYMLMN